MNTQVRQHSPSSHQHCYFCRCCCCLNTNDLNLLFFFSFSRRTQQTDDGRSLFLLRRLYLLLLFLILCVPNHLCDRIHVVKGSSQDGMKFTRIVYTYVWYVSGEQANTFPSHPIGIVRCDYYTAGWANHLASPTPSISSRSHNANAGYLSK